MTDHADQPDRELDLLVAEKVVGLWFFRSNAEVFQIF